MWRHILTCCILIGVEAIGGTIISKIFWAGVGLIAFGIVGFILIYPLGNKMKQFLSSIGYRLILIRDKDVKLLIYPYIRSINASSIINAGEEYLSLSVFFPSALPKDITLSLVGELILDGRSSNELPLKKVMISSKYVERVTDWHVPLPKNMVEELRRNVEENSPVKATLRLRDIEGKYSWETEEWTTLMLTKVI